MVAQAVCLLIGIQIEIGSPQIPYARTICHNPYIDRFSGELGFNVIRVLVYVALIRVNINFATINDLTVGQVNRETR